MKTILKFIAALLVLVGSFFSCENNKEDDNMENVPYKECEHEGNYLDMVALSGIGYLFIDSIPINLQKDKSIMYIIYDQESDLTTFFASYPEADYSGDICNFPEFAKKWEISSKGKRIYYKGILYETGIYLSVPPAIGGNLLLTIVK